VSAVAAEAPVDVRGLLQRLRYPAVIIVIGLGLVTVLAIIGRASNTAPLDPRSTLPSGGHALAVLLTDRGIPVTVTTSATDLPGQATTTVMVSQPDDLSATALHQLAAVPGPVILLAPSPAVLHTMGLAARPDALTPAASTIGPGCALPAAVTAGAARIAGDLYAAPSTATRCYRQQGDAALVELDRANLAPTFILGSPSTLSNARLADEGDAALALGLMDNDAVQWVPGALDSGPATGSQRGLFNLLPERLLWATLALFIMLVVVALWRGRRLGAPVVEPLPVVAPAAETVEGRGRLMHAARSRGLAAAALRAATLRRISRLLRLGSTDDPAAVVALVAERAATPTAEIEAVLYGGDPPDDSALVALAQRLSSIETAVRQDREPQPPGGLDVTRRSDRSDAP
jgi:hypothetical protein